MLVAGARWVVVTVRERRRLSGWTGVTSTIGIAGGYCASYEPEKELEGLKSSRADAMGLAGENSRVLGEGVREETGGGGGGGGRGQWTQGGRGRERGGGVQTERERGEMGEEEGGAMEGTEREREREGGEGGRGRERERQTDTNRQRCCIRHVTDGVGQMRTGT